MTDDERRDLETHLKEHFHLSLALQVKATRVLYPHGRTSRLQKRFFVKRERLIEDIFFWYFFGFMDLATAAFRAPVFLVRRTSCTPKPCTRFTAISSSSTS